MPSRPWGALKPWDYRLTIAERRGWRASCQVEGRARSMTGASHQDSGSLVNFQSRERNGSVWAGRPRGRDGARMSGQAKKRSGAADLEIQQGSVGGGAKSCRVWRRSLSRGSQSRQVLVTGRGTGAINQGSDGETGPRSLALA
jgi:hypothetical protein